MLEKSPAAVGCSHCQALGATVICTLCGGPICRSCEAAGGCPHPSGPRALRLGLGRRLRGVDPSAKLGWWDSLLDSDLRLVDLPAGRVLPDRVGGRQLGIPVPVGRGRVLWLSDHAEALYLQEVSLRGEEPSPLRKVAWPGGRSPAAGGLRVVGVSAEGDALLLSLTDEYRVLQLAPLCLRDRLPGRRNYYKGAALSRGLGLVAAGEFGRADFYRLDAPVRLGARKLGGDVQPVGFAGRRLVLVGLEHLEVVEADAAAPPPTWQQTFAHRLEEEAPRDGVALSPDGRVVAVAQWQTVHVFAVAAGSSSRQILERHTDRVILVRFARDGKLLVTADEDNRVVLWPVDEDRVLTD